LYKKLTTYFEINNTVLTLLTSLSTRISFVPVNTNKYF